MFPWFSLAHQYSFLIGAIELKTFFISWVKRNIWYTVWFSNTDWKKLTFWHQRFSLVSQDKIVINSVTIHWKTRCQNEVVFQNVIKRHLLYLMSNYENWFIKKNYFIFYNLLPEHPRSTPTQWLVVVPALSLVEYCQVVVVQSPLAGWQYCLGSIVASSSVAKIVEPDGFQHPIVI